MFESAWQDVRYGFRLLRRTPIFTLTAALSLAIGIGANTTIFSAASAMLLRPLPGIAEPDRLVDIGRTQNGRDFDNSSYLNYRDIRARVTTLSGLYAMRFESQTMGLGGQDGAERIWGSVVSGNYFTVLGTRAHAGRLLSDADDEGAPGSHPVMAISYELWQRRFGASPAVIGQTVPLNGYPFTIVGIAPPGFQGTTVMRSDAWVSVTSNHLASPRRDASLLQSRQAVWLIMGGRLKPGVTVAQANAELEAIGAGLEREFPRENRGKGLKALPSAVVPGNIDVFVGFLGLLMAIVGVVLLIACVNLSGMMLARASARRREIAVRLAMGASRWRLARQLLTETALLFAAGCALGLLLSRWLHAMLMSLLPQLPVPLGIDMPIDARVLGFSIVLSLVAAVLSGLAPALQASDPDLVPALKGDGGAAGGRLRLRSAFLVGQVALSLLLVVTAGLFMRALGRASAIDPGFDQSNVDVVMLDLSLAQYNETTGRAFATQLVERARSRPGVQTVALVTDLPLDGGRMGFGAVRTPGLRRGDSTEVNTYWNIVSPGYFRTLDLALVRGRDFMDEDKTGSPRVAIVNGAFARLVWGTADAALGRTIEVNDSPAGTWQAVTIVGVTADAQTHSLGGEVGPYIYVPFAQRYVARFAVVVKTAGTSTIPQMRALVREMNPNLPVAGALPLSEVTAVGLIPQRIAAGVAGSLGIVCLLLAAIGIYGVTSYSVHRRVREIGIRVALGADGASVRRLILRQGVVLTLVGVGIGLAAGAVVSLVVRSLLLGVTALDPVTFGGSALLFFLVALAASYVPARRATKVDPMIALRAE